MEKIIAGQKVVRIDNDQEPGFFNAKCRAAGVDPKCALTVTSVSHSGKWLGLDGLTVDGESHPWKRNNFEPFIEPAEASPAVVFTRSEPPKADADGWIVSQSWNRPVDIDTFVDYKLRGVPGHFCNVLAGDLQWGYRDAENESDHDIVAYRLSRLNWKVKDRLDSLERNLEEELNKRMNSEREAADKIAALESQLVDERQHRMKQEGLIERLRKVLSVNGKEYKLIQRDREELQTLHCKMAIGIANCNQVIANHSKLMQAQDVVIEQSRDNVKLALVLAASPEVSGDAVDYLARLVRKDEQDKKAKIDKLMNDRYVVDLPF